MTIEEQKRELTFKFVEYVAFLMIAIYIQSIYQEMLDDSKGDEDF
jgi:hypothetical protein